jgi:hypothetical protein
MMYVPTKTNRCSFCGEFIIFCYIHFCFCTVIFFNHTYLALYCILLTYFLQSKVRFYDFYVMGNSLESYRAVIGLYNLLEISSLLLIC